MAAAIQVVAEFTDRATAGLEAVQAKVRQVSEAARQGGQTAAQAGQGLIALGQSSSQAAVGAGRLTGSLKTLTQQGLGPVAAAVPGVGGVLSTLLSTLGGFPLVIGAVVGTGAGLIAWLRGAQTEAGATLVAVTNLSTGIAARTKAAALEVQQIQATAAGQQVQAAEAAAQKVIVLAQQQRDEKIRSAIQERDAVINATFVSTATRLQAEAKYTATVAAADATLAATRVTTAAQLAAQRQAIAQAEATAITTLALQTAGLRAQGELQLAAARARASGDVLGAIALESQAEIAAATATRDLGLAAIAAKKQSAIVSAAERAQVEETFLQRTAAIEQQTTQQRIAAITSLTTRATQLFDALGTEFEDLSVRFRLDQDVASAGAAFQTLDQLLRENKITALQAAAAVKSITDRALETGITIGQLAQVVPPGLQSITSLFRGASQEVQILDGSIQTAAGQFSRLEADGSRALRVVIGDAGTLRGALVNVAIAAAAARLAILSIPAATPTSGAAPAAFASGGIVPGRRGQAVPIVAHAGEVVIPADVVEGFRAKRSPRRGVFAGGGLVDAVAPVSITFTAPVVLPDRRSLDSFADLIAVALRDRVRRGAVSLGA